MRWTETTRIPFLLFNDLFIVSSTLITTIIIIIIITYKPQVSM